MLYAIVLSSHNLLRWLIVILGVWTLLSSYIGLVGGRNWSETTRKTGSFFTLALTLQLLIGLLLYFGISPVTKAAFANIDAAMENASLRFIIIEHFIMMIVAVVLAHIGTARIKRAATDAAKYRNSAIWYTLTILLILAAIPWDRPWWPSALSF